MIAPPYTGVRLIEYWDRLELCPVGWYRDCVGLGRFKADKVGFEPHEQNYSKWREIMGSHEIWVVVNWMVFEDDSDKVEHVIHCRPGTTLEEAQRVFEGMKDYLSISPKGRGTHAGLENLFRQLRHVAPSGIWITHENAGKSEEETRDLSAIVHSYSDQKTGETKELYQARLKALAGMGPQTVGLIIQAEAAKDDTKRKKLEFEALGAYFAELGIYWTEDMLKAWLRTNFPGSKWLCEFGKMMNSPELHLDPINHELALNWLRRGYNFMTDKERSDAIFKATGQHVKPNTLKRKRTELGLQTKRPFGPDPKPYQ
jgi:hypothetical protein